MSKHTPGPWMLATSNSWRRFVTADGTPVCEPTVYSSSDPHPDLYFSNGGADGPDARLIAAAPELLAIVQEVFVIGDRLVDDVYGHEFVQNAKAAISKATGEGA